MKNINRPSARGSMIRNLVSVALLAALLSSCFSPVASDKVNDRVTLSVQIQGASISKALARTVLPDIVASTNQMRITLHDTIGSNTDIVVTLSQADIAAYASTGIDIPDVPVSTWSVLAEAFDASTPTPKLIASGSALISDMVSYDHIRVMQANRYSVSITLSPTQTGTGAIALSLEVPVLAPSAAMRVEYALDPVDGGPMTVSLPLTLEGGNPPAKGTIAISSVSAGAHTLVLELFSGGGTALGSGGTSLGVFREAVTVFTDSTSDRWVDPSGIYLTSRAFQEYELLGMDATLQSLQLFWPYGESRSYLGVTPIFNSAESVYRSQTVSGQAFIQFTANTGEQEGKTVTFGWNGSDPTLSTPLVSAGGYIESPRLALRNGDNTLVVHVVAPNGTTPKDYTLTIPSVANGLVSVKGGTYNNGVSEVTLRDFEIGTFEVTQAQYQAVMGTVPAGQSSADPSAPVAGIRWYDALVFCNMLSASEGLTPVYSIGETTNTSVWIANAGGSVPAAGDPIWDAATMDTSADGYRLPTEAEWEFAARGGMVAKELGHNYLYSGSDTLGVVGWYSGNSGGVVHPVGSKAPNDLGIYDMSGNVWEWNWDWYGGSLASSPTLDPPGPNTGSERMMRGGCFNSYDSPSYCAVADRVIHGFGSADNDPAYFGFRVARWAGSTHRLTYNAASNGVYNLKLPNRNTTVFIKAWGAGGGARQSFGSSGPGGQGGFVTTSYLCPPNSNLVIVVGAGGGEGKPMLAGIPAAAGDGTNGTRGGGGSVVLIDNGGSFTPIVIAGGGGGAGIGISAGAGGDNGLLIYDYGGVTNGGLPNGAGGSGYYAYGNNGFAWNPSASSLITLGGEGGNSVGMGSGGGGWGGGGGGGDYSYCYSAGGGGSYSITGTGITPGLGSSTSDPDHLANAGFGATQANPSAGDGLVVISFK